MKIANRTTTLLALFACVFALSLAVGCSTPAASGSGSASSGSSSAEATSAETASAKASSEASTTSEPSAEATSAEPSADSPSAAATDTPDVAGSGSADSLQESIDAATKLGYQIFEGTLRVLTTDDLAELQDADTSMFPTKGTYAVVIFDQPSEVTGIGSGEPDERTEEATMLGIAEFTNFDSFIVEYGNIDAMENYDGEHVTIAAQDIVFPSDVSLPIGEPRAKDVKILS